MDPHDVRLPDGRSLSFYDFGNPSGFPILLFHGTPGCSAGWLFADRSARAAGVRAIAVDRPGVGRSTFQPGRTVAHWPADVAALADALELGRFCVLGWSGGAPYALACAASLAGRIAATGVVAGCCPPSWPGALAALGKDDRRLTRLSTRAFPLARLALGAAATLARRAPDRALAAFASGLSPADRSTLERHGRLFGDMRFFLEAFAQGARGPAYDYRAYATDWGFPVERATGRIELWHGEDDAIVGMRHPELLAERLPTARLHLIPDAGHLLVFDRIGELLQALLPEASPRA